MAQLLVRKRKRRFNQISSGWNFVLTTIFTVLAILTFMPLLLVISISFSSAQSIAMNGYQFIPSEWSIQAYKSVMEMGTSVGRSYMMTIFYVFVGTVSSMFVMSMFAFVLARKDFKYRNVLAFMAYFTTLFSGGLVPSYIVNTRYLHLNDTIWIFILPGMVSSFNVIVLRTFIQSNIPDALFEATKLDGGNDFQIYWYVVMPLFKAGLATIGLFKVVTSWNDWFKGILYIENPKLVPIMTLLQRIQQDMDFIRSNTDFASSEEGRDFLANLPSESTRMAISIIAILPLLVMYPFFQKYFVKGLTVGSVKG